MGKIMIWFNALFMFCGAVLTSGALSAETARQVSRSGSFDLPCSADTAFPFFSPEGERAWVHGWNPQPIFPGSIVFARDTVFRQGEGPEEVVWTILEADWTTHTAEYVRIAAASHAAHIVVKIEATDDQRSRVTVSYTVTSFGDGASAPFEGFSKDAYAAKMCDWQRSISACLEKTATARKPH
jgi:hypothetical protein